ncbi:MAG: hypothetical protein A3E83_02635 [Gammaproteobacteria bacterium RIFCSPHIGHO2_12_FULL_41_20]|nr:MAG: hypothetical protein A3E83_02635 [Gammaproteobacteria bacterium RIFCSPHIGHO2_12_FULL_41_20]
MSSALNNSLLFLINTVFDLYLFVLVIRLVLVWIRADYYHPATQFIIKLTQVLITPLRRVLPNIKKLETATLVLILLLEILKYFLIISLSIGMPNILGLAILAVADVIKTFVNTFFYAILIQAVLSWIQPYSPMAEVLYRFTSPLMRPIQRLIPPVANFDISPIPAMIGLQLLLMLAVNPLMGLGLNLAIA